MIGRFTNFDLTSVVRPILIVTNSEATSTLSDYYSKEACLGHIDDLVIVLSRENLRTVYKIDSGRVYPNIAVDVMADVFSLTEQLTVSC